MHQSIRSLHLVYSAACGSFLCQLSCFVDPNDCEDEDICGPYGECVDLPNRYYCNCQIGYYFYEDTGQCESELCKNIFSICNDPWTF